MKFVVRWLFRLLILGILLAIALVLLRDTLLEEYLEGRLRRATGLEIQIGRIESSLFHPRLTLEDVRGYNPPEFGGAPFLEATEAHFEYDPAALVRGTLRLRLLRLRVAEVLVVEDGQGGFNLRALAARVAQATRAQGGPPLEFGGIGTLNLTVDRVRRQNLRDPSRNTVLQPPIRGVVLQNLATGPDVARAMAGLALRSGLGPLFGLVSPTNAPPATLPR